MTSKDWDDWDEEQYRSWVDLPDDRDPLVADLLGRHVGDGPPMRTDLHTVLRHGRAARVRRQATAIVTGCLAVLAVVMVGFAAGGQAGGLPFLRQPGVGDPQDPIDPPERNPVPPSTPAPPPARELVIPLTLEAQSRGTLPDGYDLKFGADWPGDWNHNTPLPDAQAANATEWHIRFAVPNRPGGELSLAVFLAPRGNPAEASLRAACPRPGRIDPATGIPGCRLTRLGTRSLLVSKVTRDSDGRWVQTVLHYRPADHLVDVHEKVAARSYAEAMHKWRYTEAQLVALARNPYLVFPQPARRPPLPGHR